MENPRRYAKDTTICVVDTQTHALAARAMRLSLAAMDFADALFISDNADDTGGARHIPITMLSGRETYSRYVIKDLFPLIKTGHVLLIQWDGYIVNADAWSDDFLDYDYIGARWGFHDDPHVVGNGGFSLRSRRLLAALQDPGIDRFEPEDAKICRHYRPLLESRYGIRFAPGEVADRFSFETTYPTGITLGFHGLFNMWQYLSDAEVPAFVAAMPRSVLGSLQALSLAKNFVDLKRRDSARILLESRLQAFPADTRCAGMLAGLTKPSVNSRPNVGRNLPCPCGSGKRFKHCCGSDSDVAASDKIENTATLSDTLLQQALVHHQAGRLLDARRCYQAVLAQSPSAIVEHYLGVLDMQEGRPQEGELRIRTALAIRDDLPDFHNNLGVCLRAQDRLEEAVAAYRLALELNPSYAPAWSNIGLDQHKLGHLDEALDAFDRALALEPDLPQTRFSRALLLLTLGDYAQGWKEYEWRSRCPEHAGAYRLPAITGQPRPWQGESLAGKSLLLTAEQGIGDTLQFIRYVKLLADQGAKVSIHGRKAHGVEFLRSAQGLSEIYTGDDPTPIPAHDYIARLLSLPRLCGTRSLADVPAGVPYLVAPDQSREFWRQRLNALPASLKIGLAWAGSPSHPDDRNRSCTLAALTPLFDIPNIAWVNLQLGPGRAQLQAMQAPILDWGDDLTDYAETAGLMAELDLVITVDTSVAHAAGAIGRPVWVMLPYIPDFRWLLHRTDSPWYPTARLFRQPTNGDWAAVVSAMRAALLDYEIEGK